MQCPSVGHENPREKENTPNSPRHKFNVHPVVEITQNGDALQFRVRTLYQWQNQGWESQIWTDKFLP